MLRSPGLKRITTGALILSGILLLEASHSLGAPVSPKANLATSKNKAAKGKPISANPKDCAPSKDSSKSPKLGAAQSTAETKDNCSAGKKDGKVTKEPAANDATDKQVAKATYDGPPVLDPGRFSGLAMVGYASAKAAPEVMSNLFCYCGCDETDHHSRLIDCFTGTHGVDCHICQEEAVLALRLSRDNVPIAEIQKQIDQEFSHHYPFQEDTATYKKYKANRLWKSKDEPAQTAGPSPAAADTCNSQPTTPPKVKPGHQVGNCCGKEEHK